MVWKKFDRNIKEGEIIRTTYTPEMTYYAYDDNKCNGKTINLLPDKLIKPKKKHKMYGIAKGGFGMSLDSMGHAIFVDNLSDKFDEAKEKKSHYSARWESYWGIEIWED